MGLFIDKHFGAIGGISTRHTTNEILTVLPYSNLIETKSIMESFIEDFRRQVIPALEAGACKFALGDSAELTIMAGVAEGQSTIDFDSLLNLAKSKQKEIGRLLCAAGE